MCSMTEQEITLSSLLVRQKDNLRYRIQEATVVEHIAEADQLLTFVASLWKALNYGYKVDELQATIRDRANTLIAEEEAYLSSIRKNDKTAAGTRAHIARLLPYSQER